MRAHAPIFAVRRAQDSALHLPLAAGRVELSGAERVSQRLEIVIRGLPEDVCFCCVAGLWRASCLVLPTNTTKALPKILHGLILAAGQGVIDKLRQFCW